jgi:hypothetical protein
MEEKKKKCFGKDVRHEKFIFLRRKGRHLFGESEENALWIYEKALKFVGCVWGPHV